MRFIFPFLAIFLICSCEQEIKFEKEFYERQTGNKFPDKYKVLSATSGESNKITAIAFENADCKAFIKNNKFQSLEQKDTAFVGWHRQFVEISNREFNEVRERFPYSKAMIIVMHPQKQKGVSCTYILDTLNCYLYCQTQN